MPRLPRVSPRQVVGALRRAGFVEDRQRGSHLTMLHPETHRRVVVPLHARDLPTGTTHEIIKRAGQTPDEFRALLG